DQVAAAPPAWKLYLQRSEQTMGSCSGALGSRFLMEAYASPAARVLIPQAGGALTIAYSGKQSLSGSSPVVLSLSQIDLATGESLHDGLMKTKDAMGAPMYPNLTLSTLFYSDPTEESVGTVRLKGQGSFPGEQTPNTYFLATYQGFVGAKPQPAV